MRINQKRTLTYLFPYQALLFPENSICLTAADVVYFLFVTHRSRGGSKKIPIVKQLRVNERILGREVRVVGEEGEQLGIMPVVKARELARQHNLDLVEVAPTSVPPVCRILDYGKFKYEQAKKEQEARKGQKVSGLRQIRFRPKIGGHDLDSKIKNARKLLAEGDKVKISVMFRGREISHSELGWKLLQKVTEILKDAATAEKQPISEGRMISITLAPLSASKPRPKEAQEAKEEVKETQNAKT